MEFAVTYLDQYNNHKTINTTMYISMIYAFYNMKSNKYKTIKITVKKQHCHWIEKEEKMSTIVLLFEKKFEHF